MLVCRGCDRSSFPMKLQKSLARYHPYLVYKLTNHRRYSASCMAAVQTPHWLQWGAPHSPPKLPIHMDQSPNTTTCLIPDPSDLLSETASISNQRFYHNAPDRQTHRPTDGWRESLMTIGRRAHYRANNN